MAEAGATAEENHPVHRIGQFSLDVERGVLFKVGVAVALRPKSFAVFQYLIDRAGKLVSKDELLDALWGQAIVSDESVAQCVRDIRKAIGDDSRSIISTVPRKGYRFDFPDDGVEPQSPQKRVGLQALSRVYVLLVVALVVVGIWWLLVLLGAKEGLHMEADAAPAT